MNDRELIVYATPTGPLADACARYYAAAAELGATTAQAFPPHCTLTGFFHRPKDRAPAVIADLVESLSSFGPVPDGAVEVKGLRAIPEWVGLELGSAWLLHLTAAIVTAHPDLRPKDWLHLSLAYGVPDLSPHAALAHELVDPTLPADWEVALWERAADGSWIRHPRGV